MPRSTKKRLEIPSGISYVFIISRRAEYPTDLFCFYKTTLQIFASRKFKLTKNVSCKQLSSPFQLSRFVISLLFMLKTKVHFESVLLCISWQVGHEAICVRTDGILQ